MPGYLQHAPVDRRSTERVLRSIPNLPDPLPDEDGDDRPRLGIPGGAFILDGPPEPPPIWGQGAEVLWAAGETLAICGPQGLGKSTIAQQVALALVGVRPARLFDQPIPPAKGRVLYIAADRPRQIRRSLRRMVSDEDREMLDDRLLVHLGPLPFSLSRDPERLWPFVAQFEGVGYVIVDSLKDVVTKLSDDEAGANINRAFQFVLAHDVELLVVHHLRKPDRATGKAEGLADFYGSELISAGMGSILMLEGQPGASTVKLTHAKQPCETVGPLLVTHDHATGTSTAEVADDFRPTLRMEQVCRYVEASSAPPSQSQVLRALGSARTTQKALDLLVAEGFLALDGKTRRYHAVRCFRAAEDRVPKDEAA